MIDTHSHVIFGVDDGSLDEATSLGLLKMSAACGVTDLICTPHVLDAGRSLNWETIVKKTKELQEMADAANLPIRLYPGAELEMNWELTDILVKGGGQYCLAGSRYPLIELPVLMIPERMEEFIYELQVRDLIPIIAHPERNQKLMAQPERLLEWLKRGVLLQCNGGSFTGLFGSSAKHNAEMLLQNRVVSFIGSDAHRLERRNTDLTQAVNRLVELAGEAEKKEITELRPRNLLDNTPYSGTVPERLQMLQKETKKKSFWQKIFG